MTNDTDADFEISDILLT